MPGIVVIGSVNLDLVATVDRLPTPGETVTGAELNRFPGGKGANQALAARRLGADVSLVACVGTDAAADEALAMLRADGVNLDGCRALEGATTGTALIAVSRSGENHIVVAPGANQVLVPEMVELPAADAMICQLEVPADTIADVAARFEGFFCVNLAPAMRVDVSILQRADLVVVNETEAARQGEDIARAKPPRVEAVDTTAAGDTFTAAITVALVEGQEPEDALRFACAAGAAAATKLGAQPSVPTREEVIALL